MTKTILTSSAYSKLKHTLLHVHPTNIKEKVKLSIPVSFFQNFSFLFSIQQKQDIDMWFNIISTKTYFMSLNCIT